ncbi:MAG: hypothetical protein ACMVO3_04835 [Thalassobaculum sp.]
MVGLWYGKGPGVDRSGDVFKHGNFAGSSKLGGVLLFAGDDHTAKSSTVPHQSEYAFVDASVPVLNPAGVKDTLDFGLLGIALSRVQRLLDRLQDHRRDHGQHVLGQRRSGFRVESRFRQISTCQPGGLNIRWPDDLDDPGASAAATSSCRRCAPSPRRTPSTALSGIRTGRGWSSSPPANPISTCDRPSTISASTPTVARDIGLRLYKVGMSWPLEPSGAVAATAGAEKVLVVEEKRSLIEWQLKEILYDQPHGRQPKIEGKKTLDGKPLFRVNGELFANEIALAIADRVLEIADLDRIKARRALVEQRMASEQAKPSDFARTPYFCSGCPHNTSTKVPEGSRAMAGIGCHFLASWMPAQHRDLHPDGRRGRSVGWAWRRSPRRRISSPISATVRSTTPGSLAIRAGRRRQGEHDLQDPVQRRRRHDRRTAVGQSAHPLDDRSHGHRRGRAHRSTWSPTIRTSILPTAVWPEGARVHHRDELDSLAARAARRRRASPVLIYDQTCAAEKRRRRKRGLMEDPHKRIFINERGLRGLRRLRRASRTACRSQPVETEFGRKRQIDQSTCNKDYSCVKGFCPSFVTVIGGKVRKQRRPSVEVGHGLRRSSRRCRSRPCRGSTNRTGFSSPASAGPAW